VGPLIEVSGTAAGDPNGEILAKGDTFGQESELRGAFIQIMPLTWDSLLMPVTV
jgi:hypothetical protein